MCYRYPNVTVITECFKFTHVTLNHDINVPLEMLKTHKYGNLSLNVDYHIISTIIRKEVLACAKVVAHGEEGIFWNLGQKR